MASSSGCTPLFLNAVPFSTGMISPDTVPTRMAVRRSSAVISSSLTYFSRMFSSKDDSTSMSRCRYSSTWSSSSSGMGSTVQVAPSCSSFQTSASSVTRSITPL